MPSSANGPGVLDDGAEAEVQYLTLAFRVPHHVALIRLFGPRLSLDPRCTLYSAYHSLFLNHTFCILTSDTFPQLFPLLRIPALPLWPHNSTPLKVLCVRLSR